MARTVNSSFSDSLTAGRPVSPVAPVMSTLRLIFPRKKAVALRRATYYAAFESAYAINQAFLDIANDSATFELKSPHKIGFVLSLAIRR